MALGCPTTSTQGLGRAGGISVLPPKALLPAACSSTYSSAGAAGEPHQLCHESKKAKSPRVLPPSWQNAPIGAMGTLHSCIPLDKPAAQTQGLQLWELTEKKRKKKRRKI